MVGRMPRLLDLSACSVWCTGSVWAGIRARQILRQLPPWLDSHAMGFIPQREASAMWFSIQSQVELSLQGDCPLSGFSSDVVKAFNNLPRIPIMKVARHIGIPSRLLCPWQGFLDSVQRFFKVRDCLSAGVLSSSGYPEGDPLSPLAMTLANAVFHAYMHEFAPSVRTLSYADNYAGMSGNASWTCCSAHML